MNLKQKRLESELLRVRAAKSEQELRILEKQEEIDRLQQAIAVQIKREKELEQEMNNS